MLHRETEFPGGVENCASFKANFFFSGSTQSIVGRKKMFQR